ncbi:MAG: sulfotransferase family 2 domain-containing protein [Cyanobacteria bacterium J06621_8]
MIISHSKKFIFIHIQKTAGTSVTRYLNNYLNYQDMIVGGTKYGEKIQPLIKERFKMHKHSNAQSIKTITGDELWNSYFTFSFVRNPWDRMVSLYNWCCKGKYDFPICQEAMGATDFSQFIRGKCFKQVPQQIDYLTNNKDEVIVDFIGKQESIQEDFDYVCKRLEVPNADMLKFKHNVRNRSLSSYHDYYSSEEDIEIIKKQFASDISFFNYKF